jgi:hypothetical protein
MGMMRPVLSFRDRTPSALTARPLSSSMYNWRNDNSLPRRQFIYFYIYSYITHMLYPDKVAKATANLHETIIFSTPKLLSYEI